MTPRTLSTFIGRIPGEIFIALQDKAEWLKNPCTTAMEVELLQELETVWTEILNAPTWDKFLEARGAYRALEKQLDIPRSLSVAADASSAAKPDAIQALQKELERTKHDQRCR